MQCRRCKEEFQEDEDDDRNKLNQDTPEIAMNTIGVNHPTVVCISCFEDWYMAFAKQLKRLAYIEDVLETLEKNPMALLNSGHDANKLLREHANLVVNINVKSILWTRKGTDVSTNTGDKQVCA